MHLQIDGAGVARLQRVLGAMAEISEAEFRDADGNELTDSVVTDKWEE
jgi:hypothetical protein